MPSLRASSLLILFTCLFSLSLSADTITDFKLSDNIELFMFRGDYKFFKFQLPATLEKGYDLSIIANPYGDNDPELFLSTKEKYPKAPESSEYYSTSYGYSSIYIPERKLKAFAEYYLGVSCASDICGFNLTVDYALDFYMRPNVTDLIIDAQHGGTLVTRVYIPKSELASHIVFAAEIENVQDIEQGIQMFANAGNEIPTSSKHDVIATQSWGDGKAAYIYKKDPKFCTDCNYTIVMEIPRGSKVIFSRTIYGDVISMALDSNRNDAVEAGQSVTYAIDISRFNASQALILAEITPYYGYPYIYAHLGSAPAKLEDYSFKARGYAHELLEIPVTNKPANNLLYVTVYGKNHSTYTLNIWQNSKKMIFLPLGEPEVGQISGKGIQNYLVVAEGRKDMTMTFAVHPEQGKVDLFVKSCNDKTICNFTVEDTNKILSGEIQTSRKNPILQYSNVPDGDEVVTFDMDGSSCSPNSNTGIPRCAFVVAVLSTDDKAARYTVTANRNGLHQVLRANSPIREHSLMDQYKYYYFTVSNDVGIISLNFQVTKISGDVTVFISRKAKYPDVNNREDPLHYNDLYSFFSEVSNGGLNGTYYISVKAETSATYSIVPIIEYSTSAEDISGHHLIKLSEGIPQKMVIDNTNAAYFKFDVAFFKGVGQHQNIEIALNEVQGNFEICATDSLGFPERGNCQYSSNSTTLLIPVEDVTVYGSFAYFIGVFPKASTSTSSKAQSFSITWSASHNFRTLGFNTPFWNFASHNRSVFYKFEVHPNEDKEILIYKFTYSSSYNLTQIYLADQETKLGHDVTAFNYQRTTNGSNSNLIKLNQTDLQQLCRTTGSSVETKCYLYLAVTSTSQSEDYFTLLLSKDYYSELGLTEGMQANFPFPMTNHPLKLYYYPHQIADITILAESWSRNVTLYANIVRPKDYSSKKDWIYPTNKNYEFTSKSSASRQGESSLVIDAASLSDCGEFEKFRCGVAITLFHQSNFLELQKKPTDGILTGFSTFSMLATQDILPIGTGKPLHTHVNEGQYKYFRLSVNKDFATLFISGSIISGREMVIFASKGRDARPTEFNYEFRGSLFAKIETLEITPEDVKDGNTKGDWVIAVYGQTNTDFVLNILFEKNKMIEMYQGLPVNAIANKDPIYFRYTQYGSASQMKITKERGSGTISYQRYNKDAPLNDLPTKDSGFAKRFDQVQMILDFKSPNGWDADTYIIAIFPDSEMKVSAVIQSPGDFIYLVDNMIFSDYAANGIVNKYEHFALPTDVIDINMVVYSGDPRIYVHHNPTVNITNKIWSSGHTSSKNYIRMKLDNTRYRNRQISLESIWDGKYNVSSYPDAYYIMVVSNTPSNYSIAVSVSNSTRHLIDGHMDFGFLNIGEKNIYKYHVSKPADANKFSNLKLQFILHRDKFFDVRGEKIQKPDIIVLAVPPGKLEDNFKINKKTKLPDLERVTPFNEDIAERSYGEQNYIMNLQYRAISGSDFYIIVNNVESKNHLNYSITANSHEPIFLAMNNIFSSRVDIQEHDIYAVHASTQGLLVIEIHECMGRVAIQTSNNRNMAYSTVNPGSAVSSLGPHIALYSIEVREEQTLYIKVTGVEGAGDTALPSLDAIYKIKVNIFPLRNYLPFMNLFPGNDGIVDWDLTNSGKVQLSFTEVRNSALSEKAMKSTRFGNLDVQYHYDVFLAKDQQVSDYMSRCDLIPEDSYIFENKTKFSRVLSYDRSNISQSTNVEAWRTIEFAPESDFEKLYASLRVTVIGVDENGHHVWDYPVIYRSTEIRNIRNVTQNKFLIVLLGICLVMLTLAVVGVMYYYRKFERVKQKLNYEMQDLRNLGSTVESFDNYEETLGDKKKGGYADLVEEDI